MSMQEKARRRADALMGRLLAGELPFKMGGQKIQRKEGHWSIPIGKRWRLIVVRTGTGFEEVWFGSHEDYNGMIKRLG